MRLDRSYATPRRRGQAGFSFIEVMVVLGILSVLLGGVVIAITAWLDRRQTFATENTIQKARMTIESWKLAYDSYPPSAMTRMVALAEPGARIRLPDNDTNDGIETVFQALHWPGFRGASDWGAEEVGNTDGDVLPEGLHGRTPVALSEFLDAWGHPLVYFQRDDYPKYADGGARYVSSHGNVEPRPHRDEGGAFRNPGSYQVFSMGPDGEPNTDDDIVTWAH